MENGSRALIMAATVLLGVFLLSMMLYMFRAGGQMTKQFDEKQINLQLENYNRQFEVFDKPNNTITDVISLANLVYSTNEQNEFAEGATVQLDVVIDGITYSIPGEYKNPNAVLLADKKYLTKRNTILENGTPIDIYKLVNTPVEDLVSSPNIPKLDFVSMRPSGNSSVTTGELLTQTKFDSQNRRIYKYIFARVGDEDITYHEVTGRVKYIKLELFTNPEYPTT